MARPTTSAPTSPSGWATSSGSAFELYNKKFIAKFLEQRALAGGPPFAIYLLGGYFAITGQDGLSAPSWGVLLAYKDLPSPIKELIDWDQQRPGTCRSSTIR